MRYFTRSDAGLLQAAPPTVQRDEKPPGCKSFRCASPYVSIQPTFSGGCAVDVVQQLVEVSMVPRPIPYLTGMDSRHAHHLASPLEGWALGHLQSGTPREEVVDLLGHTGSVGRALPAGPRAPISPSRYAH
jgi:hypothetical protein